MNRIRSNQAWTTLAALTGICAALWIAPGTSSGDDARPTPQWIWLGSHDTLFFRKEFQVSEGTKSAKLVATCDNEVTLFLDGKQVLESTSWEEPVSKDVTKELAKPGKHVLAARCKDQGGAAGSRSASPRRADRAVEARFRRGDQADRRPRRQRREGRPRPRLLVRRRHRPRRRRAR